MHRLHHCYVLIFHGKFLAFFNRNILRLILPQCINLNTHTLFGVAWVMGCSTFILCLPPVRPCVKRVRRESRMKFSSALKALAYPLWERKIDTLFPTRWLSNVGLSLFCSIEIMLLRDQKRKLGPLKGFLPRSQFLRNE